MAWQFGRARACWSRSPSLSVPSVGGVRLFVSCSFRVLNRRTVDEPRLVAAFTAGGPLLCCHSMHKAVSSTKFREQLVKDLQHEGALSATMRLLDAQASAKRHDEALALADPTLPRAIAAAIVDAAADTLRPLRTFTYASSRIVLDDEIGFASKSSAAGVSRQSTRCDAYKRLATEFRGADATSFSDTQRALIARLVVSALRVHTAALNAAVISTLRFFVIGWQLPTPVTVQVSPDADFACLAAALQLGWAFIRAYDGDYLDGLSVMPCQDGALPSPVLFLDVGVDAVRAVPWSAVKVSVCQCVAAAAACCRCNCCYPFSTVCCGQEWARALVNSSGDSAVARLPEDVKERAAASPYLLPSLKILSGCDYVPDTAIRGVGWSYAHQIVISPPVILALSDNDFLQVVRVTWLAVPCARADPGDQLPAL